MVITHQKSVLDTHKEKREKNPNVTLRIIIKSQGKRAKEETKKEARKQLKNNEQNGKSTYLSTTTLNTNGLNEPIKRHAIPKRVQKQDSYICCLQETHFRSTDTHRLKIRG